MISAWADSRSHLGETTKQQLAAKLVGRQGHAPPIATRGHPLTQTGRQLQTDLAQESKHCSGAGLPLRLTQPHQGHWAQALKPSIQGAGESLGHRFAEPSWAW